VRIRRFRPVTAVGLARLPETCERCPLGPSSRFSPNPSWARAAEDRWGACGLAADHDGTTIGYILVTPALTLPRSHPLTMWARTPDSAVLMSMRVFDDQASAILPQHLMQALAARLTGSVSCLEAVGTDGAPSCTTPAMSWLESVGFVKDERQRPVGFAPHLHRVRMDFNTTVTWAPGLRSVWGTVHGWVSQPAGQQTAHRSLGVETSDEGRGRVTTALVEGS
jgi:hypothetical protein